MKSLPAKGQMVKVKLSGGNWHIGEFLSVDILGNHKIGVLKTSIPGITIKEGKKYISIFNAKLSHMEAI